LEFLAVGTIELAQPPLAASAHHRATHPSRCGHAESSFVSVRSH